MNYYCHAKRICSIAPLLLLCHAAYAQVSGTAYRVLGQPDLRQGGANTVQSASLNTPFGVAVDARGGEAHLYVADTENSRILAWRDIAAYQLGAAPALLLGQPGPEYSLPLGTGADGLYEPIALAVSPLTGDLYVADYNNNRVVRFPSPFENPTRVEPDAVYGQPNFTTRTASAASAGTLKHPRALAFDSDGNLWVADAGNNRVVRFAASSLNSPAPPNADTVIGQKDFVGSAANAGGAISATGLDTPSGLAFDSNNNLYVSDFRNGRVLRFAAPLAVGLANPAATMVWGQTGLTVRNIVQASASTLAGPAGLAIDGNRNLYVSVPGENRILVFPADGAPGVAAKSVIGQPDFATATSNTNAFPLSSAASLSSPSDVKLDSDGNPFVADSANHRILQFPASSKIATRVWGQNSFVSNGLNQVKPGSLYLPYKIAIDYSSAPFALYVSDTKNNRVLGWKDAAHFRSGDPADLVIGQPDLITGAPTVDSPGVLKPSASSLSSPAGLVVDPRDGSLYVADSGNGRVLRYSRPVSQAGRITPNAVIGRPDFTSAPTSVVTASTLNTPVAVAISPGGALFVSDNGNHRVLQFAPGAATGAAAIRVFGQPNMNTGQKPTGSTAQSLTSPQGIAVDQASNLYVADNGANRVLVFPNTESAPASGAVASFVIGQTSFSAVAATRFKGPNDIAIDSSGNIYVADTGNNRVLAFQSLLFLPTAGATPTSVIGQNDLNGTAANWNSSNGLPTPASLYGPVGLLVDRVDTLYVADGGNNRVLHFLKPAVAVNAATMQSGAAVAPGSLATLFGSGLLSDPTAKTADSSWPRSVLSRQVLVNNDTAAPISYIDKNQINFQTPSTLSPGAQSIAVQSADTGELIAGATLLVASVGPGLFTTAASGAGQAAALNQDYSLNGPSNPAAAGSTIILYGTGQGQVSPPVADGVPAGGTLSNTVAIPTADGRVCFTTQQSMCVAIGSAFGVVTYSGLAPGYVGLWQINVTVPQGLPAGPTPVKVLINGTPSNLVTIAIR